MATDAEEVRFRTILKCFVAALIKLVGNPYLSATADSGPWAPAFGRPRCALAPFQRERAMSRSASSTTTQRNQLLAALSPADLNLLRPYLTPVALQLRKELEKPNRPIKDVYFIDTGIASVVAVQNGKLVEVGLIGCEGMSGTSVVLGGQSSAHSTDCPVAGDGQHISTA